MSISSKILIPITLLTFIFLGIFLYALIYFSNSKRNLEKEISRINQVNDVAMQITVLRQQSRYNVLNYRINKNPINLRNVEQIRENVDLLLEEIRPLVTTDTGKTLLQDFELSRSDVGKDREILISVINSSDTETIEKVFRIWDIKSENNYAALLDFISYNQRLAADAHHVYEALINNIFYYQVVFTISSAVLIILLFFYLRTTVTVPLTKLSLIAQSIAEGNFKLRPEIRSNDEIGTLSYNLRRMSKKLEKYQKRLLADVRRKEKELNKLKEFEIQKDNFIVTASHELKTPVTSLKIFEQLLKREITKNKHAQYNSYLKKMDEQVDKLTRLIISLLEVARMQVGKMPFDMVTFDLNKVVNDTVYIAQKRTKKHEIKTQGKIKKEVYGDKDRIGQVLDNLLSNAIKYSPNGKKIYIKLADNRSHALVSVKDYGLGIDKKHHKKIFSRFYRVNGNNEITFPGLGVGLYISTEIIRHHYGELWVNSVKGKGATFSFTLPYQPPINKKV